MSILSAPFTQGRVRVRSGPVGAEKVRDVEAFLDAMADSKVGLEDIVVVRHPDDDNHPEYIGKHPVTVTSIVNEIHSMIQPVTRKLIVVGASHYSDKLPKLVDATVRSGRDVTVVGLNLDDNAQPMGVMPQLMALADDVQVARSICSASRCIDDAIRSGLVEDEYDPFCVRHHDIDGDGSTHSKGRLFVQVGAMFSGKSSFFKHELAKVQNRGFKYAVFRWDQDKRDVQQTGEDSGHIMLHDGGKIQAIRVRDAYHMKEWLGENSGIKTVFMDEGHFFEGAYDVVRELLPKGYRIFVTGLARTFKRTPFNDVPALMCLADRVNVNYAACVKCAHPATETQRVRIIEDERVPAQFNDPVILVGAKDDYEARCLQDFELPGEPPSRYSLPELNPKHACYHRNGKSNGKGEVAHTL